MLELHQVSASYGKSQVLWDVDLLVESGQAVALLGRNGVGKTTLLRTIVGLHPLLSGNIRFGQQAVFGKTSAFERARAGIAYVPQGRGIFPHLTVTENLQMGLPALTGRKKLEKSIPAYVYDLFPVLNDLAERKGGNLSGGQQQQLAIGRALVTRPQLLILDEPTEGIQPNIVQQIETALTKVRQEFL
jgi:urea transport system ATP-binding protein